MLIPEEGLAEETPIQDFERAEESSAPTSLNAYILLQYLLHLLLPFGPSTLRCSDQTSCAALKVKLPVLNIAVPPTRIHRAPSSSTTMAILELLSLAIRGLQFLFAIIVLGLTGHGTSPIPVSIPPKTQLTPPQVASYANTPSQDSFLVFVAIWTCLVVLYLGLAPKFLPSLAIPFAMLALDALTMLFWFAGFIALAVFDRDLHYNYYGYFGGVLYKGEGCDVIGNLCGVITAAVVFGAFEWYVSR